MNWDFDQLVEGSNFRKVFTAALLAEHLQRRRKITRKAGPMRKLKVLVHFTASNQGGTCSAKQAVSWGFCMRCWLSLSFTYTCRCSYVLILSPHMHTCTCHLSWMLQLEGEVVKVHRKPARHLCTHHPLESGIVCTRTLKTWCIGQPLMTILCTVIYHYQPFETIANNIKSLWTTTVVNLY